MRIRISISDLSFWDQSRVSKVIVSSYILGICCVLPLEAEILDLVTSSHEGGIATRSAPVCFIRWLFMLDSCVQVESMETALA